MTKIFSGSAYFSDAISIDVKRAWVKGGGRLSRVFSQTEFFFYDGPQDAGRKRFMYRSIAEHDATWILDSILEGTRVSLEPFIIADRRNRRESINSQSTLIDEPQSPSHPISRSPSSELVPLDDCVPGPSTCDENYSWAESDDEESFEVEGMISIAADDEEEEDDSPVNLNATGSRRSSGTSKSVRFSSPEVINPPSIYTSIQSPYGQQSLPTSTQIELELSGHSDTRRVFRAQDIIILSEEIKASTGTVRFVCGGMHEGQIFGAESLT